jgi:hypothetical protein
LLYEGSRLILWAVPFFLPTPLPPSLPPSLPLSLPPCPQEAHGERPVDAPDLDRFVFCRVLQDCYNVQVGREEGGSMGTKEGRGGGLEGKAGDRY